MRQERTLDLETKSQGEEEKSEAEFVSASGPAAMYIAQHITLRSTVRAVDATGAYCSSSTMRGETAALPRPPG